MQCQSPQCWEREQKDQGHSLLHIEFEGSQGYLTPCSCLKTNKNIEKFTGRRHTNLIALLTQLQLVTLAARLSSPPTPHAAACSRLAGTWKLSTVPWDGSLHHSAGSWDKASIQRRRKKKSVSLVVWLSRRQNKHLADGLFHFSHSYFSSFELQAKCAIYINTQ